MGNLFTKTKKKRMVAYYKKKKIYENNTYDVVGWDDECMTMTMAMTMTMMMKMNGAFARGITVQVRTK